MSSCDHMDRLTGSVGGVPRQAEGSATALLQPLHRLLQAADGCGNWVPPERVDSAGAWTHHWKPNPMTHRIVSLIASATEIVCALGFEDALVGRSHECDYPPSVARLPTCSTSKVKEGAPSEAIDRQVRRIVGDGLSVYRVDPDLLNRLAPTVIVTQTQCDVCAVSLKDVEQAVCDLVSSRPAIVSLEPLALGDVWRDIRAVAAALAEPARGEDLVARLEAPPAALHAETSAMPGRPSIACIEWIDPLMLAGNWVPELVDCAGGVGPAGGPRQALRLSRHRAARRRRPRRGRHHAVRLRHRARLARDARACRPAGMAAVVRRAQRASGDDRREPVLQPARPAAGGVGGDPGRVLASGVLRLRTPRSRLEILGGVRRLIRPAPGTEGAGTVGSSRSR